VRCLQSKLRIATEVVVAFPPEHVMPGLAPIANRAPIQAHVASSRDNRPNRAKKPLFGSA
jgi:hypothetical protein